MKEVEITAWTVLFFNVSAIGFIFAFLLFFKKNNTRLPYLLLGLYTLVNSYQIFEYDLYWTNLIFRFPHFSNLASILDYSTAPLLFLFFRSAFNYSSLERRDLFHFIPFLIAGLFKFPYITSSAIEKLNYHFDSKLTFFIHTLALPWLAILQSVVYAFFIWRIIKFQGRIGSVKILSNILLYLFILLILSKAAYYVFVNFSWFNPLWDYNISVLISISILISGWLAIISPTVFNGLRITEAAISVSSYFKSYDFSYKFNEISVVTPSNEKKNVNEYKVFLDSSLQVDNLITNTKEEKAKAGFVKYRNSGLTESASEELKGMLDNYMVAVKLYRENTITLDNLALKLNTTRHNLSQVINEKYKLNFFDYINMLRIKEAKEILSDKNNQKLHIIDIAFQVGYNNKATFNNAFKKFTGVTPTEYRNQAL